MSADPTDPEMRRRFDEAQKIRIGETPLRRPALRPSGDSLRAHFASEIGRAASPLENPHVEPRVAPEARDRATPASVLIAVVLRPEEPTLLVTQRHHGISYPGHWVFPGGRADPDDSSVIATALRETEEEIGLDPDRVEVLGRLGEYVSHSGFRITPALALVEPPFELSPHPGEVVAIHELPLSHVLDSRSYFLFRFQDRPDRAHFALDAPGAHADEEILLTGVTVSLCIGLYGELLRTHPDESDRRTS